MVVKQYAVCLDFNNKPIGLPEAVDATDEADVAAAFECVPIGTCHQGLYSKSDLIRLGYFVESDFDEDEED